VQPDFLQLIISALVGAGGLAGIVQLYKAVIERKKVPADINLTVLGGAEKALLVMKQALDDAEERISELKSEMSEMRQVHRAELIAKDEEIRNLQVNITTLRNQFTEMVLRLDRIQSEVQAVQDDQSQ
jgi:predicted RNase H-like nuclease (RuvC/YqgF family)